MSRIRFFIAMLVARLAKFAIRLIGREGTHYPGSLARRIDPNFLQHIEKPKHVLSLTGTNGKTTVANMVSNILTHAGIDHVQNTYGSNLQEGAISALLEKANWRGKMTVEWGVFEVDEIASRTVFPALQPSLLLVTNLFRDSYRRNAHTDYIASFLNASIPDHTKLIVNADDLISAGIKPNNARVSFSLPRLPGEREERTALINDLALCPTCFVPMVFDFQRYHHIGQVHCPVCGLRNPEPDYVLTDVTASDFSVIDRQRGETMRYARMGERITDLYNQLTTVALLREAGFEPALMQDAFKTMKIAASRFESITIGKRNLTVVMGKDQNPVATTRTFAVIGEAAETKNTAVLIVNEVRDNEYSSENIGWIYDCNLEYLIKPNVKFIGVGTPRHLDFQQRLELAGFPAEKFIGAMNDMELAQKLDLTDVENIYLVFGTKNKAQVAAAKAILIERMTALAESEKADA